MLNKIVKDVLYNRRGMISIRNDYLPSDETLSVRLTNFPPATALL